VSIDTSEFSGFNYNVVSCVTVGAVACPTPAPDGVLGVFDDVYRNATVPTFPAGASFTLTYTLDPIVAADPGCGSPTTAVINRASIDAPRDVTDPDSGNNSEIVTAQADGPGLCPTTDVSITKTQSSTVILPGSPVTYTLTVANLGPSAANGATITDYVNGVEPLYSGVVFHLVSCTTTGGVACPALPPDGSPLPSDYLLNNSVIADFPAGSSFTVTYTLDPVYSPAAGCNPAVTSILDYGFYRSGAGVTDTDASNDSAMATVTTLCADISVNKSVTPSSAQAGASVSYTVAVSNSTSAAANSVLFTDALPTGFVYVSSSCLADDSASTCGSIVYDALSRTVTSSIAAVGPNLGSVTFTITGIAGTVPGTYQNTATAGSSAGADAFLDPNLASNASTVSLQVFNTSSTIAVTKQLSGFPSGGLPAPVTFTGTITCGTQGSKPWSVTVPAGTSTATSAPVAFFDGEACTIAEDAPPTLPAGFAYDGPTVLDPTATGVLGPSQTVTVQSTTPVTPVAVPSGTLVVTNSPSPNDANGNGVTDPGDVGLWTVTVTNTGDGDITGIVVDGGPGVTVSCPDTSLAAHASMTCTANSGVIRSPGDLSTTVTATGVGADGTAIASDPATAHLAVSAAPGDPGDGELAFTGVDPTPAGLAGLLLILAGLLCGGAAAVTSRATRRGA
jgi:uncharacterized repeat protein (TIGR01451 family)